MVGLYGIRTFVEKSAWVRHHTGGGNTQRHCHSALKKGRAPPLWPCRMADMRCRRLLSLSMNGRKETAIKRRLGRSEALSFRTEAQLFS